MSSINRQVRLAARPSGLPQASDWELTSLFAGENTGKLILALDGG